MPETKQIVPPFNKEDIIEICKQSKKFANRFEVADIKKIPADVLDQLKCGDVVVKITVQDGKTHYHAYVVSSKVEGTGVCLTYTDASGAETQSYDYVDGVWTYNSQDKGTF